VRDRLELRPAEIREQRELRETLGDGYIRHAGQSLDGSWFLRFSD
jgi:hypothetical protein